MGKKHFMRRDGGFGDPIVTEEPVVETEEVIESEVTEEIEEIEEQQPIKSLSYLKGKVVDCKKLNVRPAPFKTAEPLCVINEGATVRIDLNKSTDDWFSVCTEAGVEGYCMQKYIAMIE